MLAWLNMNDTLPLPSSISAAKSIMGVPGLALLCEEFFLAGFLQRATGNQGRPGSVLVLDRRIGARKWRFVVAWRDLVNWRALEENR